MFPTVSYHSLNAKRRLLQMPSVCIRIHGDLFLMEKISGLDYTTFASFLEGRELKRHQGITKEGLRDLLILDKNDRERECIRYAVYKASGVTQTKARQQFGLENMYERSAHVEACVSEAKQIQTMVSELAALQDQAILNCYCGGLPPEEVYCTSDSSGESDADEELPMTPCELNSCLENDVLPTQVLLQLLLEPEYN